MIFIQFLFPLSRNSPWWCLKCWTWNCWCLFCLTVWTARTNNWLINHKIWSTTCQCCCIMGFIDTRFCILESCHTEQRKNLSYLKGKCCWFHGSPIKGFPIFFPVFWLTKVESSQKSNRTWFFGHFSRHICSAVTETIRVTNYATSFGAKKCSEMFEATEMILDLWNQQSV